MSKYNKSKDRDNKGKIRSKYKKTQRKPHWKAPRWFTNLVITRPKRREEKVLCQKLRYNDDDLIFPLGNQKPREYWD